MGFRTHFWDTIALSSGYPSPTNNQKAIPALIKPLKTTCRHFVCIRNILPNISSICAKVRQSLSLQQPTIVASSSTEADKLHWKRQ